MSISVSEATKIYGSQKALNNVSFEIKSGEVIGFLGPNGAGKSTMMKILTGYLPATSGIVKVCGHDVSENNILFRRKIGYLPEHNPLYLDMYVSEYLTFTAEIFKLSNKAQRVDEIIQLTGLTVERHKKIGALSKGYRQRVGLAQALLPDPEVLILDEPTTGLDPNQIAGVRELIKELGKSKTILLSTHIMQEVKAICERVIIINNGVIVADDLPENLELNTSSNDNIIEIEFDKQPLVEELLLIEGVKSAKLQSNNIWLITSSSQNDLRADLFRFAVSSNRIILGLSLKQQSLEDVFKSLTQ
jgi:ABC-2 type transport system ATP-binding protein